MKSFNYCKRFIDSQIKLLNNTLVIDDDLKEVCDDEGLSLSELKIIITKINVLIKRHNNNEFQPRISNQIINQILKYEREKVTMVHERLRQVENMVKPLILPEIDYLNPQNLKQLDTLINELPESRYLFINNDKQEDEGEDTSETENVDQDEEDILVQDDEEMITEEANTLTTKSFKKAVYKEISDNIKINETLLDDYETTRLELIELNQHLQYKFKKLQYLTSLRSKLSSLIDDKSNELTKFKILVDSINYKMDQSNKQEIITTIKESIN
ncbi:hypothetical protein CLIB1444_01S20208 [[Candida] jaroonii]|uniref:Uncharacterized protein n=1 Tax=[Candida] jaroonii TaxID=467808 RepID=A0ACA9Y270_9ASCO|nr:hypothetical protein CLIB1444_01S20208 [[Candida] jaroonii]